MGKRKGVVSLLLVALMVCVLVVPAASALASMRANPTDPAADVRLDNPGDDVVETRCAVTGDRVFEFADGSTVTVLHYSPASILLGGGGPIKCERNANVKTDIVLQLIRPSAVTTLNIDAELAAAGEQIAQSEVDQARRIAQDWVHSAALIDPLCFAEWEGAQLTSPQPYHNPSGEVIAYMFAVENNGETVGHVLIGSSAYGFSVFMGGPGRPFPVPPIHEVSRILRKEHGLQIAQERIGEPRLLLLSLLRGFYATWDFEGQVVGMNLITGHSFVRPSLEALNSAIPSPVEYKAARRAPTQSFPQPLQGEDEAHKFIRRSWQMDYFSLGWCGPSSGVSIGQWKRLADGDTNLDASGVMYYALEYHMNTLNWPEGWTLPWHYGPGFVAYGASVQPAEHFDYTLYRLAEGYPDPTFCRVVNAIAHDSPLAFVGWVPLPGKGKAYHWWAVEGWAWSSGHGWIRIVCNFEPTDGKLVHWGLITWLPWYLVRISDTDN